MPTSLPALTSPTVQSQESATTLYHVLANPPTQTSTAPSSRCPHLTDAQRCRMRGAGEEYGCWSDALVYRTVCPITPITLTRQQGQ